MSQQDLSAATGTLDTSETGGATSSAVVEAVPLGAALPEGRPFRPESETRDLVNAAYGVVDADPYVDPNPDEPEVPEGAIVADVSVSSPEDEGATPVVEGDPQPTDVTSDPEALAAAAAADAHDVEADQAAAQAAGAPVADDPAQVPAPAPENVSDVPVAPPLEETPVLAPGSEQGADGVQVHDPAQAAADALAAADAALAAQPEQPQS